MTMALSKIVLSGVGLAALLSLPNIADAQIMVTEGECNGASRTIRVRVHGIRSGHGYLTFLLYGDKPEDFLAKGKFLFKRRFPAKRGTVAICLVLPEAGTYSAVAYHDENGNKKFDKNWIGIPTEGFGVSNNPRTFLGPPTHKDAAFHVRGSPTRVEIELKY